MGTGYRPLATVYFTTCDIRLFVTVCHVTSGHWSLYVSLQVTSGRWSLHVTSGHWLLYVSLHVTSNRVLGVLLLAGNGVLWFYSMCILLALLCVSQHFVVFYCSYSIQFREPVWTGLKQLYATKSVYVVSMT